MRYRILFLCLPLALIACRASVASPTARRAEKEERIDLPAPRTTGAMSLEEALAQRHSVRSFAGISLTFDELGQLLWAAQGITRDWGGRTAPSAGALYPLELYLVTETATYHYLPAEHSLVTLAKQDLRDAVWAAGLRQDALREAPATLVIAAVFERTETKYGDRATRYVYMEAGHAAQNVLLQAVALDLGAVPIGAFHEQELAEALELPPDHTPIYLVAVGHPKE